MATQPAKVNVRSIGDLEDLANVILASAKTVKSFLSENNIPAPSFSADAPSIFPDCPQRVQEARNQLLDASKKIHQLALGPIDHLFDYMCSVCPASSLVKPTSIMQWLTCSLVQHW